MQFNKNVNSKKNNALSSIIEKVQLEELKANFQW